MEVALGDLTGRSVRPCRRDDRHLGAVADGDERHGVVAELLCVVRDAVEDGLDVEAGRADRFEHVAHRRLAFECPVEIVEQIGVGDGDRRLIGEGLQDRQLRRLEGANLEPADVDAPDPVAVVDECNSRPASDSELLGKRVQDWIVDRSEIVDADRGMSGRGLGGALGRPGDHPCKHVGTRAASRFDANTLRVADEDRSAVGLAQPDSFGQDSVEHDVEFSGMGADQAEDVARRGLQFERLGEVGVAFLDLGEETSVVDGDGGLVCERSQERDLVVGVPAGFGSAESDHPDGETVSHHRHDQGALATGLPAGRIRVLSGRPHPVADVYGSVVSTAAPSASCRRCRTNAPAHSRSRGHRSTTPHAGGRRRESPHRHRCRCTSDSHGGSRCRTPAGGRSEPC